MFETTVYESTRRIRGTAVMTIGLAILSAFFIWYFSVLDTEGLTQAMESLPPTMLEAFGVKTIATIEGFLAAEVYNFIWVLGLGLYFAYTAGGLIAGDIERNRMDLLLSFPVSRSRLLVEKFSAVLLPILVFNVVIATVIYGAVTAIGESIAIERLVLVHVLSIPYLVACTAIGSVFTVLFDRAVVARRSATGLVFALFLLKSVTGNSEEYEWIQNLSPMQYYDPTAILLEGTYRFVDAGVLLGVAIILVIGSQLLFTRRDI